MKPLFKKDANHSHLNDLIEKRKESIAKETGKVTKHLFPVFTGSTESFLSPQYTSGEIKKSCVGHDVRDDENKTLSFSWRSFRHTKSTSLAQDGHDILSIMMELGHTSPDMTTAYVNNRLELKKKALTEKGGGRFYTIEGDVDSKVGELLLRKDQLNATRVCGSICTLPSQIGEWCEHANAYYTCKYYRADGKDLEYFEAEKSSIATLIEEQYVEAEEQKKDGKQRMSQSLLED